jgi:hypothetical protein
VDLSGARHDDRRDGAAKEDGRIVLTGRDEASAIQRWSINDIQTDSSVWRFESSNDDGKTWRLLGVNQMRRRRN